MSRKNNSTGDIVAGPSKFLLPQQLAAHHHFTIIPPDDLVESLCERQSTNKGAAMFWILIGLAVFLLTLAAVLTFRVWAAARNAPTLRSRRFQIYSIFWALQYLVLFIIAYFWCSTKTADWLILHGMNKIVANSVIPTFLMIAILGLLSSKERLKRIVENDLGLSGEHVESCTYPQVERRFFLSLLTNLLLAVILHIAFVGNVIVFSKDVAALSFLFLAQMLGGMLAIALATAVYYALGRSLLETCRTKQTFLNAPPLVDNALEVLLVKTCKHPDKEAILREAIARFDPATMTEDEPEVAAKPFPRHWFWFGGFYAVFMFGMFCLAVMAPNDHTPRGLLKQTGIIENHTVPGDFVPWNPERYCRRGMREVHENPQKAIEEYSIAIRLNPRYAEAYERRAHCWLLLDAEEQREANAEKAIADISEAIRLELASGYGAEHYYIMRAMMYERLGEPEKAAADWKNAGYPK